MLSFYNTSDVPNKLNKTLTFLGSTTAFQPTAGNTETSPVYLLDKSMPANTNYIYDSDMDRYYFVVEVEHNTAKRIVVTCALDALYSFRNRLDGKFYFIRGAEKVNEMDDSSYPLGDYIKTETYNFEEWPINFFQNTNVGKRYLLRTAAGRPKVVRRVTAQLNSQIRWQNWVYTIKGSNIYSAYLDDAMEDPQSQAQSIANNGTLILVSGEEECAYKFYFPSDESPSRARIDLID